MCLCGLKLKKTLFSTNCTLLLLHYAPPLWNALIFYIFSFWEARRSLIGQLSSALWLAEYLNREKKIVFLKKNGETVKRVNHF